MCNLYERTNCIASVHAEIFRIPKVLLLQGKDPGLGMNDSGRRLHISGMSKTYQARDEEEGRLFCAKVPD